MMIINKDDLIYETNFTNDYGYSVKIINFMKSTIPNHSGYFSIYKNENLIMNVVFSKDAKFGVSYDKMNEYLSDFKFMVSLEGGTEMKNSDMVREEGFEEVDYYKDDDIDEEDIDDEDLCSDYKILEDDGLV